MQKQSFSITTLRRGSHVVRFSHTRKRIHVSGPRREAIAAAQAHAAQAASILAQVRAEQAISAQRIQELRKEAAELALHLLETSTLFRQRAAAAAQV